MFTEISLSLSWSTFIINLLQRDTVHIIEYKPLQNSQLSGVTEFPGSINRIVYPFVFVSCPKITTNDLALIAILRWCAVKKPLKQAKQTTNDLNKTNKHCVYTNFIDWCLWRNWWRLLFNEIYQVRNLIIWANVTEIASTAAAAVNVLDIYLSAAFDTIDHSILTERHRPTSWIGLKGTVLLWVQSYLTSRSYRVILDGTESPVLSAFLWWPEGSVHGPLLFTL